MAEWKCQKCGWKNAGSWEKCAKCGFPKNPTKDDFRKDQEDRERIANFIVTTTHHIEGMEIECYLGIVSSVVVLGTGIFSELSAGIADMFGSRSGAFQTKLSTARETAINELIVKALEKNSNAVIGVDLEYMTIDANMLMVSANGTAVRIRPISTS